MNENQKFKGKYYIKKYDEYSVIIKDVKYYKETIKKISIKLPIFIGFIMTYYLYFLSLEACYAGEGFCPNHINWIKKKVLEEVISCIFMAIMIQLIILKIISKIHIIHIIITFITFYCYSHGMVFENHGYYNFILFFVLVAVMTVIMAPFDIMKYCMERNKNTKLLLKYLFSFLCLSILFYFYLFNYKSNCSDWSKGLNNTYIENNTTKYGCQIRIPTKCTYKIFKYVQDFTKFSGKDCKSFNSENLKQILLSKSQSPFIKKTSRRIGFPLTNKDPECFNDSGGNNYIYKYVLNNLVDMDDQKFLDKCCNKKIPEIQVDFVDKDKGKIIIELKFNKTLSEERRSLEKKSKPYSNNIILLFIDSLSRANAIRQLKRTMNFFEKFMPYKGGFNEKYPSEIFHSFQFFKYHSFIGHLFIIILFYFMGKKRIIRIKLQ